MIGIDNDGLKKDKLLTCTSKNNRYNAMTDIYNLSFITYIVIHT